MSDVDNTEELVEVEVELDPRQLAGCGQVRSHLWCDQWYGSGMAKSKISVSLDPDRLGQAQSLVAAGSVSELLDVALAHLIEEELERRHIEGYVSTPVDDETARWAQIAREPLNDDVDWAALYGVKHS